ncbi:MAG: hypothetical protein M1829_000990 [Trizodia sp. TS-e1964]|nr:MAG: hypothetical protein M1829_000990 [Trizodia sp. TS-e1964]
MHSLLLLGYLVSASLCVPYIVTPFDNDPAPVFPKLSVTPTYTSAPPPLPSVPASEQPPDYLGAPTPLQKGGNTAQPSDASLPSGTDASVNPANTGSPSGSLDAVPDATANPSAQGTDQVPTASANTGEPAMVTPQPTPTPGANNQQAPPILLPGNSALSPPAGQGQQNLAPPPNPTATNPQEPANPAATQPQQSSNASPSGQVPVPPPGAVTGATTKCGAEDWHPSVYNWVLAGMDEFVQRKLLQYPTDFVNQIRKEYVPTLDDYICNPDRPCALPGCGIVNPDLPDAKQGYLLLESISNLNTYHYYYIKAVSEAQLQINTYSPNFIQSFSVSGIDREFDSKVAQETGNTLGMIFLFWFAFFPEIAVFFDWAGDMSKAPAVAAQAAAAAEAAGMSLEETLIAIKTAVANLGRGPLSPGVVQAISKMGVLPGATSGAVNIYLQANQNGFVPFANFGAVLGFTVKNIREGIYGESQALLSGSTSPNGVNLHQMFQYGKFTSRPPNESRSIAEYLTLMLAVREINDMWLRDQAYIYAAPSTGNCETDERGPVDTRLCVDGDPWTYWAYQILPFGSLPFQSIRKPMGYQSLSTYGQNIDLKMIMRASIKAFYSNPSNPFDYEAVRRQRWDYITRNDPENGPTAKGAAFEGMATLPVCQDSTQSQFTEEKNMWTDSTSVYPWDRSFWNAKIGPMYPCFCGPKASHTAAFRRVTGLENDGRYHNYCWLPGHKGPNADTPDEPFFVPNPWKDPPGYPVFDPLRDAASSAVNGAQPANSQTPATDSAPPNDTSPSSETPANINPTGNTPTGAAPTEPAPTPSAPTPSAPTPSAPTPSAPSQR